MQCTVCNERFKKGEGEIWETKTSRPHFDKSYGSRTQTRRKEVCNKCLPLVKLLPACPKCGELLGFDIVPCGGYNTLEFEGYFHSLGMKLYDHLSAPGVPTSVIYVRMFGKCLNYDCDNWGSSPVPVKRNDEFFQTFGHKLLGYNQELID